MNKNRGFTLIELLAVIVILAIIALIAVPVVMNIIAGARKSAAADSAYSVVKAGELHYSNTLLDNPTGTFTTKVFSWNQTLVATEQDGNSLEIKGTKPTGGKISIDGSGYVLIQEPLIISGYSCSYKAGSTSEIVCDVQS